MQTGRRLLIGVTSGTTCDGVDAALLEAEGVGLEMRLRFRHGLHQGYQKDLREMLLKIGGSGAVAAKQNGLVHRLVGEAFAVAARAAAEKGGCSLQQVQCVGLGGHQVWHETEGRYPSSIELGMPAVVAERTGLTVIDDFRARDLSVGGTGAALMALVDHLLFKDDKEARALVHLGGMAGVVFLPPGARPRQVLGFHAGPCSLFLNSLISQATAGREPFDAGGKNAVQGRCLESMLESWLSEPAIQRRPPRMVPMQLFGEAFAATVIRQARQQGASLNDLLCTATHFVARAIGLALTRFLPQRPGRVLVSGGGMRNGFLWQLLEQQLPGLTLEKIDTYGVPAGLRRAVGLAGLAALTLDGVPANLTTATGASSSRLLGSLTPGSPPNWARCLAWMASMAPASLAA